MTGRVAAFAGPRSFRLCHEYPGKGGDLPPFFRSGKPETVLPFLSFRSADVRFHGPHSVFPEKDNGAWPAVPTGTEYTDHKRNN